MVQEPSLKSPSVTSNLKEKIKLQFKIQHVWNLKYQGSSIFTNSATKEETILKSCELSITVYSIDLPKTGP